MCQYRHRPRHRQTDTILCAVSSSSVPGSAATEHFGLRSPGSKVRPGPCSKTFPGLSGSHRLLRIPMAATAAVAVNSPTPGMSLIADSRIALCSVRVSAVRYRRFAFRSVYLTQLLTRLSAPTAIVLTAGRSIPGMAAGRTGSCLCPTSPYSASSPRPAHWVCISLELHGCERIR